MRHVELLGLCKVFAGARALDQVDLAVSPGEQLALLGPSGSGKSTLLRIVAGLEQPDAGDVRFDHASTLGLEPHRRDVALVFQQYALYPHLSALENITLGLRHGLGLSPQEAAGRARDVAARLGIQELLGRRPKAMSGGQRQRVALARALARRAGVVLLDEPLSGLDAQLRLTLRVEIASHLRASGASVIHVTHDQSDAMASADRIAVMRDGHIEQVGPAQELYRRPATLFVARFIGTPPMNVFPLEPIADEAGMRSPFGVHRVRQAWTVTLGVRPEHLRLGHVGPWRTVATVVASEQTGPEQIVHVTIEGHVCALRAPVGTAVRPGGRLNVSVDAAEVHVFAGATEGYVGSANEHAPLIDAASVSPQPALVLQ